MMPAIERLLDHEDTPSVSLFLSTTVDEGDDRIGRERLKSLLDEAETRLRELKLCDPRDVLGPGRALLEDGDGWQRAGQGAAVFLSPSWHEVVPTPFELPQLLVIGRRPQLRPLLEGDQVDKHFYVLALSRNKVRLFEASRFEMRPMELEDVPAGMSDALKFVEAERPVDIYRGHGGNEEIDDERVSEYFRAVHPGVLKKLDGSSPLVLAGVEYLHPLYRRTATYPHILPAGVTGNFDSGREGELHDEAWRLVEPLARRPLEDDMVAYGEDAAKGRAAQGINGVLMAALQGRVRALFVRADRSHWGTFDRQTGEAQVHHRQEPGDEDLLELATSMTLQTAGRVWVLPPERMPSDEEVVASARF